MAISKAELKNLASLKAKKGRTAEGRFMAEGVRVLEEAIKFNFLPEILLYSNADLSERGKMLISQFQSKKIESTAVSTKELNAICDTETGQGIVGVFDVPTGNLSKLYKPACRRVLLCDRINDPGNLGTLIRTALAFEFDIMAVTDNSVEMFSPKVVRSSAGAIFGLPLAKTSYLELKQFKVSSNATLAAAVARPDNMKGIIGISQKDLSERSPMILAIGAEADGLSQDVLTLADFTISISHSSQVESLNAAVAGAILMQEIYAIRGIQDLK